MALPGREVMGSCRRGLRVLAVWPAPRFRPPSSTDRAYSGSWRERDSMVRFPIERQPFSSSFAYGRGGWNSKISLSQLKTSDTITWRLSFWQWSTPPNSLSCSITRALLTSDPSSSR